jgi:hypothetical protein
MPGTIISRAYGSGTATELARQQLIQGPMILRSLPQTRAWLMTAATNDRPARHMYERSVNTLSTLTD